VERRQAPLCPERSSCSGSPAMMFWRWRRAMSGGAEALLRTVILKGQLVEAAPSLPEIRRARRAGKLPAPPSSPQRRLTAQVDRMRMERK